MNNIGSMMKDACGPCLTEKQLKKQKEEQELIPSWNLTNPSFSHIF